MKKHFLLIIAALSVLNALSQKPITELSWRHVATGMADSWYGSVESVRVAENILLYQRDIGGWPKNIEKHLPLSDSDKAKIVKEKSSFDAIFDNSATTTELRFLALMFGKTGKPEYKDSYNRGLKFILDAQYGNGGWPMFWPLRKGYYTHITFNDDAIVNILSLLREINNDNILYKNITSNDLAARVPTAFNKGIECILKTQIRVNRKPTVWCAQHDETTLQPAKARSYELPSFSGGESAGIVSFLMDLPDPTPEIISSVEGAIAWFETNKLNNVKLEYFTNSDGLKDRRVVSDPSAGPLWARFYDLETLKPYFCDRDGIKKSTLGEIGYERRNGYSWYTDAPLKPIGKYPEWKRKLENQKTKK